MTEHHIEVTRTARFFTLGTLDGPIDDLWIVCHGYGQLARGFLRDFEAIHAERRLIVAPEGLSRYYTNHQALEIGASWMTKEDRTTEINDYIRYLDTLHHHLCEALPEAPKTTRVLGFSQGAATVCRWVAHGRVRPRQLILWGGTVPPDLDLPQAGVRFAATELLVVVGERDEFLGAAQIRDEEKRLEERGIQHRLITFPGGHRMDDVTLTTIAAAL